MYLDRVKNTKRNIVFGTINQVISLLLPFIVRTVIIKRLGIEFLGLNSLFGSMLQVLNLAELGFGSAIVYHMYKPIAQNDKRTICALMNLYKSIYKKIGLIILIIGFLLLPFLPKLIKNGYPEGINIYILFLIYLINTVLTYWLFAYKTSILNAFQRVDIISIVNIITKIILNMLQITILLIFTNYYIFLLAMPFCTIVNNVLNSLAVDKLFPDYNCEGEISRSDKNKILENIKGLALYKVCQTTRNTFDSIFISAFLGLTTTAIYTNYFYIISSVTAIIVVISNSMLAGVGNSIVSESADKNYLDMKKFDFLYMWLSGWCTICIFCLIQPFMRLWVGKEMMFDPVVVFLLCIYFYGLKMGDIKAVYSDAAGLWWENRYRTLIESIANIILNFIMVQLWGIYGIISATIVTLLIFGYGFGSKIVFKYYFRNSRLKEFFKLHIMYAAVTFFIGMFTIYLCEKFPIEEIRYIIYRGIICCIIPNILYYVILSRTDVYKAAIPWLLNNLQRNFKEGK